MTSRGNPSISPPAQIPQQRHVNAISSGTPPPQQFIPGQTPALQPSYELLQHQQTQGQPLLSYQAYGSALNDPRGQAGNSGRGGPPQQNLPQGGAYYPQQPLQNMMPQQSQQGPTTHQSYYISAQRPGGYRQRAPQPQPQSGQQMFYMTPTFPGNNVIMQYPPAARVPLYQPYATGNPPFQNMYFPNGGPAQWPRGPTGMAPTATPNVRPPAAREKKPLTITDPESGRNILEEVVNRPRSTGGEEQVEETPADQSNQEIRKTFTRLVADRLKSPDESSMMAAPAENQGTVSGAPAGPTAAVPSSQQYQQPPPQQQVQQQQQQQPSPLGPNTMMRPHMTGPPPMHIMPPRPGMMQQPPTSATPPQDMQLQGLNVNLSMPPPQIPMRQPTPVHIYPQQQQQQQHPAHHGPRHPQPPQQQPQQQAIRTAMPPNPMMVVPPQQPQTQPQSQPHPQPPIPAQVQPQAPPPSTAVEPATQTVKTEPSVMAKQKPQAEATPQDNIPAKSTGPAPASAPAPVTKTPSPPSKEESPALSAQPEPAAEVKPSAPVTSAPATTPKETPSTTEEAPVAEKTEEPSKEETPQGASTQGVKDGRKGKNKKKDFNRKEIGGSDMDAFIDSKQKTTASHQAKPEAMVTLGQNVSAVVSESRPPPPLVSPWNVQTAPSQTMPKRDPRNPWNLKPSVNVNTPTSVQSVTATQSPTPTQSIAVTQSPIQSPWVMKSKETESQRQCERTRDPTNPWKIAPVLRDKTEEKAAPDRNGTKCATVSVSANPAKVGNIIKVRVRSEKVRPPKQEPVIFCSTSNNANASFTIPLYPSSSEPESASGDQESTSYSSSQFAKNSRTHLSSSESRKNVQSDENSVRITSRVEEESQIDRTERERIPVSAELKNTETVDSQKTKEKVWDDANSGAGEALRTRTNNAIENQSETSMGGTEAVDSSAEYSVPASDQAPAYVSNATANANASSSKEPETEESEWQAGDQPEAAAASDKDRKLNVPKSQDSVKPVASPVQVESKHKLKKKKKKKGRKTPPIQKAKQSASANESSETVTLTSGQPSKSAASEIYGVEDKENETVDADAKPPLPPTAGEAKNAQQEKPTGQEAKTTAAPTPVSQEPPKVTNKEPSPQPPAPAPTPSTAASAQVPKQEEKAPAAPREPEKSVQDTAPAAETPSTPSAPSKNQNQQATDQVGGSIRNNRRLPGQTERQSSQPLDNGIAEDARSDSVPSAPSDTSSDATKVNHQAFNDENEPPKEAAPKQKVEESRKGQPATDSDDAPMKPPAEKVNKVKRDGKLQYDRNYLMELRECASSQTKPEGLPNLEIILDKPVTNRVTNAAPLDFTPAFFQPQSNQRHPAQIGKSGSRGRQRPDIQMAPRVIKSVSLQNDVKPLHQSEKPWQPKQKQATAGEVAEKKKSLESEVLFIMNRLTPTNFERLAGEMRKLNIKTYEDLQELVKIFFDKVTMETKFVEAYANLCKVMCGLKVPPPPNSGLKENQATFRVVMLTKCQQEFEADKTIIFEDPEEKKKKMESEMPEGPERDEHIEKTLYQMKLKRLKFYGNIRFIGELFKLGMLTENIMHDCIFRLLKARDDDSLVSLCNLITTVGQNLDTDKAKGRMDQYFAQMGKIADERKSRIKFTLKDAIDLRSNNWVPRKEQTGPKKIDEVHKDFQQEQATKQFLQSQPLPPRQETPQPGSRRGSRQRQDDKPTDDGWNTVGSKSLRIDASKMKLSKNVVDENNIQLGPGGGMNKFSMWSRGSYGGAQPTQEPERPPTNRFSALRGEEERRNFQRSPNRGDSNVASRGMRQGPTAGHGRGKILARSSQEGERRDALASARSIVGGRSQNSSRDNSWNREDRRQPMGPRGSREGDNPMTRSDISLRPHMDTLLPPSAGPMPSGGATAGGYDDDQPVLKKLKPMSEEEMEHKAKTILEEYLSVRDLEEAKLCLMELEGQAHLHILVTACINDVLEKTIKDRELTGQFFHEMVKNNLLSFDLYIKGLGEVLQYAEDMVIDIPMMWTYLAQMIVPLLLGGSLPWSKLLPTIKPHLEGRCGAKLVAEILLTTKSKTSEADVAQMWQSNGLQWTELMDAGEVDNFLKDKKLEFTVSPVSAAAASRVAAVDEADLQKVTQDIEKMVRENAANDKIFDYIKRNVKVEKCEKNFVRALMTAIANSCISPSGSSTKKVVEDVVKVCKDILMKYIKNAELELQALYAIQALMHKLEHPSGVIVSLFDTLYDEEIISEDAFKQWEKSTDEQEGKGPCSMQLTQFFTWLRENEEPEASS